MGSEELRFVHEAFESNYIAPLGPQVNAFEKEFSDYVGPKHCVALTSGTGAMHIALRDIGVGPGPQRNRLRISRGRDEIFASSLTFIGNVNPVTSLEDAVIEDREDRFRNTISIRYRLSKFTIVNSGIERLKHS